MQHLNLHLRPGLGHLRLVDLEALHAAMRQIGRPIEGRPSPMLRRLLEARSDTAAARRPLSDATIGRVHANVTSARSTAVKRRTIPVNPAEHLELPSGRADRALVWTEHRVQEWRRTGKRPAAAMVRTPEQAGAFLDWRRRRRAVAALPCDHVPRAASLRGARPAVVRRRPRPRHAHCP
jgi:hypothetical protein